MKFTLPYSDPLEHSESVRRAVAQREQAVRQAFRDHNARIRPLLPPPLQCLQETDLHDGLFQSLCIDAGQKTLQMRLLCGDLQQGYFDLTLNYKEIELSNLETSLLCFIAHEKSTEINRNEIDLDDKTDSRRFIHRISWNAYIPIDRKPHRIIDGELLYAIYTLEPEIELRFGDFALDLSPRPNRNFLRDDNFITVVCDRGEIEGMN